MADFRAKLGEEINARAKVDSDYIRATKINKHFEEICRKKGLWDDTVEKECENDDADERRKKRALSPGSVEEKCRQFEESGKCKFGYECFRVHPTKVCRFFSRMGECQKGSRCLELHRKDDSKSERDCDFWLRGYCRYPRCYNKHDPNKKGSTRSSRFDENRAEGSSKSSQEEDGLEKRLDERLKTQETFLAKGLEGIANMVKQISSSQPTHQHQNQRQNIPTGWNISQEQAQGLSQLPYPKQQEVLVQKWPHHQNVEMMDTVQMNQRTDLPEGWKTSQAQGMGLPSFLGKPM